MKRTVKKTAYTIFFLLISSVTVVYFIFNNDTFQNWLTKRVTNYLGTKFKTTITIGHIHFFPFTKFSMDNIYWGDQKNDTLFYVEHLTFNFGGFNLDSLRLSLNDVKADGALCKIVTYSDSTFNIDVLFNILNPLDTIPDKQNFKLYFNHAHLTNTRFRLIDSTKVFEKEGFDGFNQDFNHINIIANNFWIIKDSLNFDLKNLTCREQCGVEFTKLTAKVSISQSGLIANDLLGITKHSFISKRLELVYNGWDELADYNNKVNMLADLKDVKLDMQDIGCIAPFFKNQKQLFLINGKMTGQVNNLKGKNMSIKFGDDSRFDGNIHLKGLPDIGETYIDVKADNATTTISDLEYLLGNVLPNEYLRLGKVKFKGHYTGFYNDFVAFGDFNTNLGDMSTDINMKLNQKDSLPTYSGNLALTSFDLGEMFGIQKYIGRSTLKAFVEGKSFDLKTLECNFKTDVKYFYANGYNYQNLTIKGLINKKIFEGNLSLNDPNAKMNFKGTVDLHTDFKKFKFNASINNADLYALKIDDNKNVFSTNIDIDFAYKDIDNNHGTVILNDILFIRDSANYRFKQVKAETKFDGINKFIRLQAPVLDFEMKGNFNLVDLPSNFRNIMNSIFPEYVVASKKQRLNSEVFSYKISVTNSDFFSDVFYPKLRVYDLNFDGKVNSLKNSFTVNGVAATIMFNDIMVKNYALKIGIENGSKGQVITGADEVLYNDTSILKDFAMLTNVQKNKATNHIKISDSTSRLNAEVLTELNFHNGAVDFIFSPSTISYRKAVFTIPDSNKFYLNDTNIFFDNFKISQGKSEVNLLGTYDFNTAHNLSVGFNNIDIGLANTFFPKLAIVLGGKLNGTVTLKGSNHQNFLNILSKVEHLTLDNDTFGDYTFSSNYSEKQKRFLVYAKSINGKLKNLEAGGFISTDADKSMNIDLLLNESDVHFIQPFIKEYVLINSGSVSAKCKISGTLSKPNMDGEINLSKADFRIEYIKTRYHLNSVITFTNDIIKIPPSEIFDEFGKKGIVEGSITHSGFSDMNLNIVISKLNHVQLLNTTAKDNTIFYGTAFGSGSVNVSGAFHDILLETDLTTEKGTSIFIPLISESETGDGNFINFINKDTALKVYLEKTTQPLGFELNCNIHATPDANFELILDERTGDRIKGRGKGTVNLELTKQGAFNMYGQVVVEDGEYGFTAANIFKKKFILLSGGTLSWNGDPMQTQMDIQGMYYLRKVSISELVSSTTTSTNSGTSDSKVPVECLLYVNGNLSSPEIKFDLNFPDLQSSVGTNNFTEIQNVVRTLRSEPDMMNQQVMSLMLFGKFVPLTGNNSNSTNAFNSGYATTLSGILTSQANSLFGNIIPGLDFNLDYQNATDITKSRTIFSASKKFYNNRLEVQTSYDPQFANTANISTQYSISKDGNLKIKAYSKNTNDPIYGTYAITQGVGLYYRKEFDTFLELFNKNKAKKF